EVDRGGLARLDAQLLAPRLLEPLGADGDAVSARGQALDFITPWRVGLDGRVRRLARGVGDRDGRADDDRALRVCDGAENRAARGGARPGGGRDEEHEGEDEGGELSERHKHKTSWRPREAHKFCETRLSGCCLAGVTSGTARGRRATGEGRARSDIILAAARGVKPPRRL